MSYNFVNYNSDVTLCNLCIHDSNLGYETDFSINGNVDHWTWFDGIHTYGCWNNFLFGTLYGDQAMIGRHYNIMPIDGETYYLVSISMLVKLIARDNEYQAIPTRAKFMWTTLENSQWDEDKSFYFDLYADSNWHTYSLDMSSKQKWVGYISNLRLYPVYENGRDGDEFFVKSIQVRSKGYFECKSIGCSYYNNYIHPCGGIGARPYCDSSVFYGDYFSITRGENNFLILNINEYGDEVIPIDSFEEIKPRALVKELTRAIGSINIGGYAEAEVVFTDENRVRIYAGTYSNTSSIVIKPTQLAKDLGFFDDNLNPIYFLSYGVTPATEYKPNSSFKITPAQTIDLIDNDKRTYVEFNPGAYNVEAGRRDWYLSGLGVANKRIGGDGDESNITRKNYYTIDGVGKTLIDFNHPFNASGRINIAYVCGTSDYGFESVTYGGQLCSRGEFGAGRLFTTGCKFKIFRPKNDGTLEVIYDIPIEDRNPPTSELTSEFQEYSEAECDLFVNKGDLIGIYNMSLYYGKTNSADVVDATYYSLDGDLSVGTVFNPGTLKGNGSAGLLLYVRSGQKQNRLKINVDLKNRTNISDVYVKGSVLDEAVEYNIMRCLDFSWDVDLFGHWHQTHYVNRVDSARVVTFTIQNKYYGKDRLNDGIYTVPNGKSADSFTMTSDAVGVVPVNPYYFFVNGDCEWMAVHYFPQWWKDNKQVSQYKDDPVAFTIIFPYRKKKNIHKCIVHFKDMYNFRSFALSTYQGPQFVNGDADDVRFKLIPEYTAVVLDGMRFTKTDYNYASVDEYLFNNPSLGHPVFKTVGGNWYRHRLVTNDEAYNQAAQLDWKILQHEWDPISCYGFRFYCIYHESTKICEMELFGYLPGGIATITAGTNVLSSFYGNDWFIGNVSDDPQGNAFCPINNSIRYLEIEINPINTVFFSDIEIGITNEALYFGDKGCEDDVFLEDNTLHEINDSSRVDIKNFYKEQNRLLVDISKTSSGEKRTLYYSDLSSKNSIESPEIGPAATYKKDDGYDILNQNRNVAINCECYGLRNMLVGAKAFYSYDNGYNWLPFNGGQEITTDYVNLNNLPNMNYSVINIPVLHKSKYWRLSLKADANFVIIREILVYRNNELLNVKVYHDREADVNYSSAQRRAPHLLNTSVTGSYYRIKNDEFITIELEDVNYIDKIIIYHDTVDEIIDNSHPMFLCGVDKFTVLYIENDNDNAYDYSYYENDVFLRNVYIDKSRYAEQTYSVTFDFMQDAAAAYGWRSAGGSGNVWYTPPSGAVVSGVYENSGKIRIYSLNATASYVYTYLRDKYNVYYYKHKDQNPSFEMDVIFDIESRYANNYGHSFGFIGRNEGRSSTDTFRHAIGASFGYYQNTFRIRVQPTILGGVFSESTSNFPFEYNKKYYCRFTGDGTGNYRLRVWSDNINGSMLLRDFSLYSEYSWEADAFGVYWDCVSSTFNTYINLYYMSVEGRITQTNVVGSDVGFGSLKLLGRDDSYVVVPKKDYYIIGAKKFSLDFFVKFEELPYGVMDVSGNGIELYPYNVDFRENGKFGWRGYFNGSSYVRTPTDGVFNLADVDFTIDFLVVFASGSGQVSFLYRKNSYRFYFDYSNSMLRFDGYSSGVLDQNLSAQAYFPMEYGKQYHIALSRVGNSLMFFVDGKLLSTTSTINGSLSFGFSITHGNVTEWDIFIGQNFIGYIEEFRITKGVARWSENFTIPLVRYITDSITAIMCRFDRGYVVLAEDFNNAVDSPVLTKAWSIRLIQHGDRHTIVFYYNNTSHLFNILVTGTGWVSSPLPSYIKFKKNVWYHIYLSRGYSGDSSSNPKRFDFQVNGIGITGTGVANLTTSINQGTSNIVFGRYLAGHMKNMRFCITVTDRDDDVDGVHIRRTTDAITSSSYTIPWNGWGRLYTYSVNTSLDNLFYGKHSDIDLYKESNYSYFDSTNVFSSHYRSFFAIDMGNRYDVSLVRSYGVSPTSFNLTTNTLYSKVETEDPNSILPFYTDTDDFFTAENDSTDLKNWLIDKSENGRVYIRNNMLNLKAAGGGVQAEYSKITAKYLVKESFAFEFDYGVITEPLYAWTLEVRLENFNNANNCVKFERGRINNVEKYKLSVKDSWNSSYLSVLDSLTIDKFQRIKLVRFGSFFSLYKKDIYEGDWIELVRVSIKTPYWEYTRIVIELKSQETMYPDMELYLDNIKLSQGNAYFSNYTDARWVIITILNGDGVSRNINKVGVYTNVQRYLAPGGHGKNNHWIPLGKAVTSYDSEVNLAYYATVSGSSYFKNMHFNNIADGNKEYGGSGVWGSNVGDSNPFVILDLGDVFAIYRVKIYHGLIEDDTGYMIRNYTVGYSTDGVNYTTFYTITNNDSFERSHDANPFITARYIRVLITGFVSKSFMVYIEEERRFEDFRGAVLREVEVYKYNGAVISSESYPFVAINLNRHFYLNTDHEVIGVNYENKTIDWDVDSSSFCYSDYIFDDPNKVIFGAWGKIPSYEKWLVVKKDTATGYSSGPHYMRKLIVRSIPKEIPTETHNWWWSSFSNLSNSYEFLGMYRSLKISYTQSTSTDTVRFIEGDSFGIDPLCSWRDCFSFLFYISNIDALDLDYGYFYFGGYDSTETREPVVYKWNIESFKQNLNTGLNNIRLIFRYADSVEYQTARDNMHVIEDTRNVKRINFGTIGFVYRGTGVGNLVLAVDDLKIRRNHFDDFMIKDYGLYLTGQDYFILPVSDLKMSAGSISFWMKTDFNLTGVDEYGVFSVRNLFNMSNSANDVFGMLVNASGFNIYGGNIVEGLNIYQVQDIGSSDSVESLMHIGLTFSNTGENLSTDGSTIRLYINNKLYMRYFNPWPSGDSKYYRAVFGGRSPFAATMNQLQKYSSVDAVISNLRVYNYCKTDFSDDMELNYGENRVTLYNSGDLIEISKDNVTFYKVGEVGLPLVYEEVPYLETCTVYIRSNLKDKKISGIEDRVAGLVVQWDVPVG